MAGQSRVRGRRITPFLPCPTTPPAIALRMGSMAKSKRDPVREARIQDEAIVDAYGPEEQAMGWYYYLKDKIRFPFQAKCIAVKAVSPPLKGEKVEVRGMAPEEACASDMLVLIKWQGRPWRSHPVSTASHQGEQSNQ